MFVADSHEGGVQIEYDVDGYSKFAKRCFLG